MRKISEGNEPKSIDDRRMFVAMITAVIGLAVVAVLAATLPEHMAKTLLDKGQGGRFPFSVQTPMWVLFFVALGEIYVRYLAASAEARQLRMNYLPEDDRTVLVAADLGSIYGNLRKSADLRKCFLPRLIDRCILQFQSSKSSEQSASLLNTSVEMFIHEVDLRYNMLRYICWVIPSLGFIGTVIGIGSALEFAGDPKNATAPDLLTKVTGLLAVSFEGTFLALVLASILVFLQNIVQSKEEHSLNLSAQYCLDNLINRLYVQK
ncbi:MAG: MotA/TolQ/ExbB proton channel family protein [Candidatus Afipia apatlaquensis]|uniref:MotA/TolQ/ExbB proton channel family protein n=1 Tax=Candidatus Afipia apatlaquensis TaxID=2712852 RepID=A0A7C9VLZ1_9BRAD|nr:MotA/TolQ/ExbB proton channel family protein [Candidatus Afipia apatlaquensis]